MGTLTAQREYHSASRSSCYVTCAAIGQTCWKTPTLGMSNGLSNMSEHLTIPHSAVFFICLDVP